ncbi:MAG: hypothetical protein ACRDAX_08865 [Propionibacteriaceae bacterium]
METFAETLQNAIANQPLTLERISLRLGQVGLPISVATLSYWQTGRSIPTRARSRSALAELGHILGLEPGTLEATLKYHGIVCPNEIIPAYDDAEYLLKILDLDLKQNWTKVSMSDHLFLDEDGYEITTHTRVLLRAENDSNASYPIILQQPGSPGTCGRITKTHGMTLSGIKFLPERNLTVASGVLNRKVTRGALTAVEYIVSWDKTSVRSQSIERCLIAPAHGLLLEATFAGKMPTTAYWFYRESIDSTDVETGDVIFLNQTLQTAILDARIGIWGIRWKW